MVKPAVRVRPESVWAQRLTQPGWLLLPLRAFLGITFCFAGLQKLANPAYLNVTNPTSVAGQMRLLSHTSPIGVLLRLSSHAPVLVGLAIAIGELAVGVGTLTGLFFRVAAVGGALLSLTFFLTVSWNTTPYYYGSDIVFVFAWLTMFAFGTGGVLSVEVWARKRARSSMHLRGDHLKPRDLPELDRRAVVVTGAATAAIAAVTALVGGLTAVIGRAVRPTARSGAAIRSPVPATTSASRQTGSGAPPAPGTAIVEASALAVGQARPFTDPASQYPAWLVHANEATFVAFSAVCTHAGCSVEYDPSGVRFICPCHGGVYDARTGQVLGGPPPAPLQRIPVRVVGGKVRVDT